VKIILIDLILHKTKAYRHLLFSVINQRRVNFEVQTASFSYVYFLQFIVSFFQDALRILLLLIRVFFFFFLWGGTYN